MKIQSLEDAFVHELSDMRSAEQQLTKALPKMAKAGSNRQLVRAIENHLKETEGQLKKVEQLAKTLKLKLKREKCDAMAGLVKEGDEIIKEVEEGPVRDAMIIAAAQKVEHYEIASYGTLVELAKILGYDEAIDTLEQILDQEKNADETLNDLAINDVNEQAMGREGGKSRSRQDRGQQGQGPRSYSDDRYYNVGSQQRYSRSSRDDERDYHERSRGGGGGRYQNYSDMGGRSGRRGSQREEYYGRSSNNRDRW